MTVVNRPTSFVASGEFGRSGRCRAEKAAAAAAVSAAAAGPRYVETQTI